MRILTEQLIRSQSFYQIGQTTDDYTQIAAFANITVCIKHKLNSL